jgi:hypothetical protein
MPRRKLSKKAIDEEVLRLLRMMEGNLRHSERIRWQSEQLYKETK